MSFQYSMTLGQRVTTPTPPINYTYSASVINNNLTMYERDGAGTYINGGKLRPFCGYSPGNDPSNLLNDHWEADPANDTDFSPLTKMQDIGATIEIPKMHTFPHWEFNVPSIGEDGVLIVGADGYATNAANRKKLWFYSDTTGLLLLKADMGIGDHILYWYTLHYVSGKAWLYFGGGQETFNSSDGFNNKIYRTDGDVVETVLDYSSGSSYAGFRDRSLMVAYSTSTPTQDGDLIVGMGGEYPASNSVFYDDFWRSADNGASFSQYVTGIASKWPLALQTDISISRVGQSLDPTGLYANGGQFDENTAIYINGADDFSPGTGNKQGIWVFKLDDIENATLVTDYDLVKAAHASGRVVLINDELHSVTRNLYKDWIKITRTAI